MVFLARLICVISVCFSFVWGGTAEAQSEKTDREFWRTYTATIKEFDFESVSRHQSIYALLEIVKQVNAVGKPEFAQTLLDRARKLVGDEPKIQYRQHLFLVALTFDNLDLAVEIAKTADEKRQKQMLDSVALEKLKRGHADALKGYPRHPLDFFSAIEHGNVLADSGKFDEADKFIQTLAIPHEENDPRGVGAIVYSRIAEHFQKTGDANNARKYIEKAMTSGGNLFYTGYGVKVKKYLIFGEMNQKQLSKMQKLGVAYRGHMRRELLSELIRELCLVKRFEDAQKTVAFLEKEKERDKKFQYIAVKAAAEKDIKTESIVSQIKSADVRAATRFSVAAQLSLHGHRDFAEKTIRQELDKTKDDQAVSKDVYRAVGGALGLMANANEFKKCLGLSRDRTQ